MIRANGSTNKPGSPSGAGLARSFGTGATTGAGRGLSRTNNPSATSALSTPVSTVGSTLPSTYTYGTGNNARGYRAYGYGRGYRNNYYGAGTAMVAPRATTGRSSRA